MEVNTFKSLWFFLFLVCGSYSLLSAQPNSFQFRQLNVDDGLSHNQVTCFLKDRKGFMWMGTASGLNRFDGYSIKVFRNDSQDSTSLPDNSIVNLFESPDGEIGVITAEGLTLYNPESEKFITETESFYRKYQIPEGQLRTVIRDADGGYWFIHQTRGLLRYDLNKNKLQPMRATGDKTGISSDSVTDFTQDNFGNYWIIHSNGTLEAIREKGGAYHVVSRKLYLKEKNDGAVLDYRILADKDGDIWVFAMNDNQGLYFFDVSKDHIRHFSRNSPASKLNTDLVRGIIQDEDGRLWVSTDHGGINLINKSDFSVIYMVHREEDEKTIAQNSINALYRDSDGIIWIGTFKKGVSYYHRNIFRFFIYRHSALHLSGLPYGDVNRFVEDKNGDLWIGTNGGGLIHFDRKRNVFTQFRHDPKDVSSLSSDVIVSLCIDYQGKLWIGTYYGGLNCYDGKRFIRYTHSPGAPGVLREQNIWEIFEDSRKQLWIGTLTGGLYLFNREMGTFSNYREGDPNSIQSNYIAAITEDRAGNLWVGTDEGIDVLNHARGRFFHFENEKKNPSSLSDNAVLDMHEDSRGRIWIGTEGGLNLFNSKKNTFKTFKESDGLPHNTVLTVLEDSVDNLWVSTPNGISHIEVVEGKDGEVTIRCKNYDEADGLQGRQFNENAALRTRRGELIFGGANGFNIFKPARLQPNRNLPPVIFSGLQLYNRAVQIGEKVNGEVILPKALSALEKITLPPGQNVFSIEFAALNFFHPEKTEYEYQLEGFNASWLPADAKSRKVTFTNLDPSEYVFRLRAVNSDGYPNDKEIRLKIEILPPFWKTDTAFVLYVLLIIGALLGTRKLIQKRERIKFTLEQERREAMRLHELDLMKISFFTNVSHEFRTPLTLILTPLEKMLRQSRDESQRRQFELIHRNAKRLLNLVNQLLDFRKLETQAVRFNASEGDIIRFIEETVYSFSDLSEKKNINLEFQCAVKSFETIFDQDKLEKILFNLLSNAFKFTPPRGLVAVTVDVEKKPEGNWINIGVKDTGVGIAPDKHEKIFERFFQGSMPKSVVNQGSGIGLSITREFVKIHGGTIKVESRPGEGSCFTVRLPLTNVFNHEHDWDVDSAIPAPSENSDLAKAKKPVLLLVEDNEDFRYYLKDNLLSTYDIIEAGNGMEGWDSVLDLHPDLIVSDIMMPLMNGIELCARIKNDQRVSHIPVILLTARTAEEQKLEGFESGADDYITKPFNFEILTARIKNLILQRKKLHSAFPGRVDVKASELKITSLDEKFINNAIKLVEENVSNPGFSVEQLSHQLGISRAHFYKKVVALTGKSPLEFIRTIRLQMAAQMLEKSQLTVAEVAYKVGFNNPKYFTRYFKEQYKVLPSMYAIEMQKDAPSS